MPGPYPVLLAVINQQVNRALGEDCQAVEINNAGSNCWVVINDKYVAGPYQQNVVNLPSPVNYVECKLTSTAAPGQTNPSNPQGIASLNFYPFQPAPGGAATPPANPGTIVGGAGWKAAADPNALVKIAAGDAFLTSQVNQLINLVTGVMTGQPVTLADGLSVNKLTNQPEAVQGITFDDLANGFAHGFLGYVNGNVFRIFSRGSGADVLTLDELSNLATLATIVTSGLIDGGGTVRARGNTTPSGSPGAELLYTGATNGGLLACFDRSTSTAQPVGFSGSQVKVFMNGVTGVHPHHWEAGSFNSSAAGDTTVNFKFAYAAAPIVILTTTGDIAANLRLPSVVSTSTGSFVANVRDSTTGNRVAQTVNWHAMAAT